jgi:hypothetical protein
MDCNIDAGGLQVFWLTGVNAAQSVALLESLMPTTDFREDRRMVDNAISAIALHKDPAADAALDRNVVASKPEQVRRQAAFWLGNARGQHGYQTLTAFAARGYERSRSRPCGVCAGAEQGTGRDQHDADCRARR